MLLSRVLYSIWIMFSLCFYIFIDDEFGLVLLILTFISLILLVVNIFMTKDKLNITVPSSDTIHKKENGIVNITILNEGYLPISKVKLSLEIYNRLTGEQIERSVYVTLNAKEEKVIPLQLQSNLCGAVELSINSITYYDFLGVFSKRYSYEEKGQLYILPNIYETALQLTEKDGSIAEDLLFQVNKKGENGLEIFGVKEYSPGDNVKNIHWNLTSKFNELIVKELTEEVTYKFLLLIDLTLRVDQKEKVEPIVTDAMIEATVSVSKSILVKGFSHTIGWLDPKDKILHLEMINNEDDLNRLMRKILNLTQVTSENSLLDYFLSSKYVHEYSNLVYVSSENVALKGVSLQSDLLVKHLICSNKESDKHVSTEEVIHFNPVDIEEQLRILSI